MARQALADRFQRRHNGTLVLIVALTFVEGRDDALIERIAAAPRGRVAPTIREMMRSGVDDGEIATDESEDMVISLGNFEVEL